MEVRVGIDLVEQACRANKAITNVFGESVTQDSRVKFLTQLYSSYYDSDRVKQIVEEALSGKSHSKIHFICSRVRLVGDVEYDKEEGCFRIWFGEPFLEHRRWLLNLRFVTEDKVMLSIIEYHPKGLSPVIWDSGLNFSSKSYDASVCSVPIKKLFRSELAGGDLDRKETELAAEEVLSEVLFLVDKVPPVLSVMRPKDIFLKCSPGCRRVLPKEIYIPRITDQITYLRTGRGDQVMKITIDGLKCGRLSLMYKDKILQASVGEELSCYNDVERLLFGEDFQTYPGVERKYYTEMLQGMEKLRFLDAYSEDFDDVLKNTVIRFLDYFTNGAVTGQNTRKVPEYLPCRIQGDPYKFSVSYCEEKMFRVFKLSLNNGLELTFNEYYVELRLDNYACQIHYFERKDVAITSYINELFYHISALAKLSPYTEEFNAELTFIVEYLERITGKKLLFERPEASSRFFNQ